MQLLTFGTDGWRDIIADGFTFGNLGRCAHGYGQYLQLHGATSVLVGYDTRFLGERFARHAAGILAGYGLQVRLAASFLPTPALSFAVKHYGADGGVMLTASHNPAQYHGFKLKGSYGGTATDDLYRAVAQLVNEGDSRPAAQVTAGSIEPFDIRSRYYAWLDQLLDVDLLRSGSGTLIHDAMGGAAASWLRGYAEHAGLRIRIAELRGTPDPLFHGVDPEPIARNLQLTSEAARNGTAHFATATDGDGDRLGVMLPDGSFFNSHQIFAVLLQHLHSRGERGRVVKTFTVARTVELLAARLGLSVTETPVGFKYIVGALLEGDVLIGGEESGGIGVTGHIPERDGIVNSLLLLETVLATGKGLAEQFRDIEAVTGWQHAYDRLDLQLSGNAVKDAVLHELAVDPPRFAGREVTSVERLDGVKLNLSGNAWLLFRASGTEPVLRIYCEAASDAEVSDILQRAASFVAQLGSETGSAAVPGVGSDLHEVGT
jgi:phosphomannomutase